MKYEQIMKLLKDYVIPGNWPPQIFLLPEPGLADIYKCIVENGLHSCIELGTGIGATSCIMAAAVDEVGNGRVVTVDIKLYQPVNVEILKSYAGLGQNLEVVVDGLGYNWYLADLVKQQTKNGVCEPLFDFCLLDGAHEWEPDALAFYLVARLLKPGGWIVLDDVNFFLRSMPNWHDLFPNKSDRELDACQVGMIYELVVRQHPDFYGFFTSLGGRFGWARKKDSSALSSASDSPVQSQYALLERENQLLRENLEAVRRGRVMRFMNWGHKRLGR